MAAPMNKNLEWLRRDFLTGGGFFGPFLTTDELGKSRMFIDTMEDFIHKSEEGEVASLAEGVDHLTPDQKDEFWQWHYPIHWQEVFATRIRSGFVIQLCSFVEGQLEEICRRIELIARVPLKLRDLHGSTLSNARKYMEAFGKFTIPSEVEWQVIERIFYVRNVFVHQRGYMGQHEKKIIELAGTVPGLKFEHSSIELDRGFCEHCVTEVTTFHDQLRKAYEVFRIQSQILEKLEAPEGAA